jgi:hypothetical protein
MPLDSQLVRDGDIGFIGYASRLNPASLKAGVLQASENMRLDRGVAVTRKGVKRLADNISPANTPLTIPFVLSTPGPVLQNIYGGGILASTLFVSQDRTASEEVVVLVGPEEAYTYLPSGELADDSSWADTVLAVDSSENLETDTGDEIMLTKLAVEVPFPDSPEELVEATDRVSLVQAFDRLYLFRQADATVAGWEQQTTNPAGITVVGTVATVNVSNHGYTAGMRVRIEGSVAAAFDAHEYDIVNVIGPHSFTITVPSGINATGANVAGIKIRRVKPPLYWSGTSDTGFVRTVAGIPNVGVTYRRLHSVPWANYINNRLVAPDGPQNVMLSDVFDSDTFDPFWQSFRVDVGGSDRVVAVHPWVEGTFLVFCRKSIWLATVGQFASVDGGAFAIDSAVSKLEMLTDEVGCAARRTIATAGQYIYFLSDAGVYRLDAGRVDLKLRGETLPLSDPIADQLQSLNASKVEDSVAIYFNNRYYLAVPLAGSQNNNGVFIYSQLNEAWETQDIYAFGADNFVVANADDERRLMISNRAGKLMLLDEIEAGDQSPDASADVTTAVPGRIVTRRYGFGSMHNKRFARSLADVVLPNTAAVSVRARMVNPDQTITLVPGQTNTSGLSEDYTLKQPIRQKAHYCELEFLTTAHRPEIRNVSIEAMAEGLPQTETRNAA